MKAIILAAGYATRLFPLTENFPKPLIRIGNKLMIEHVLERITELGIEDVYVVTNEKFTGQFQEWAHSCKTKGNAKITIVNDGTTSNDDRLGAIGDINFTIDKEAIDDDLLIVGGDNLFKFSLTHAKYLFDEVYKPTITGYDVKDRELAKKYGIIEVDNENKVVSFVEKPPEPKSTVAAMCVYFYPKEYIDVIKNYLKEGNNPDAPGNLPAYLVKTDEVYAKVYDELWYDVGGFESLKEAKEAFGEEDVDIEKLKKGEM
ncbi:nucleotidyltransferase family protein [Candidatus Woesearchaeota archaeon]|nr:nucleotidyltransferase family protein [Candidatus Woesearchaeota archaeon]